MKTAILGWGSLIYELRGLRRHLRCPRGHERGCACPDEAFWREGGPELPIELSRVSSTRQGALTLVVDPRHGTPVPTRYALSRRIDPRDVLCDLREREGTVYRHVGLVTRRYLATQSKHWEVSERLARWAAEVAVDAVVWTDLPGNFAEVVQHPTDPEEGPVEFSVPNAIRYLRQLAKDDPGAIRAAHAYVTRAPDNVRTPLRMALEAADWWRALGEA